MDALLPSVTLRSVKTKAKARGWRRARSASGPRKHRRRRETNPTSARTKATRRGRPPPERAGEVEARILQAVHQVFIARGYEGASIDEIAEVARAGKQSISARFINKETLFREVITRWVHGTATAMKLVAELAEAEELKSLAAFAPANLEATT
jgi:hypothetical protein